MLLEYNQQSPVQDQSPVHTINIAIFAMDKAGFYPHPTGTKPPAFCMSLMYTFAPSPTAINVCFGRSSESCVSLLNLTVLEELWLNQKLTVYFTTPSIQ